MALDRGIKIRVNKDIKDSEYIVKVCLNQENAYLNYKKSNFLKNKEKD